MSAPGGTTDPSSGPSAVAPFAQNAEAGPSTPRPSSVVSPETPTKAKRRSWFGFGGIGSSSPSVSTPPRDSKGVSSRRQSVEGEMELMDRAQGRAGGGVPERTVEDDIEELTIDGQPLSSPRKGKRRSKPSLDAGEVVALEDMSLRRGSSRSTVKATDPGPGLRISVEGDPEEPTSAVDGRQSRLPDRPSPPIPTPRTSSLSGASIPLPPQSSLEKRTPPLPTDRPLPPLPPETRLAPPPSTDIIITPSSPRKLRKSPSRRASSSMTDLSTRNREHAQSSQDEKGGLEVSKTLSRKSSLVGLGLPRSKPRGASGDEPPPVPSKPVSVSSPHPSRPSSPLPKIAFVEPDQTEERGRKTIETSQDDKDKKKRARSLSGIFGKAPAATVTTGSGLVAVSPDDVPSERMEELDEPGKVSGVLGWLGMKKGKRRASDGKALDKVENSVARDHEAGSMTATGDVEMVHQAPQTGAQGSASTLTVVPNASSSRIFSRRLSRGESEGGSATGPQPIAVPRNPSRLVATSSSSSLHTPLPAPSPTYFSRQGSWVESPTNEEEEIIFSPPGAPWVETPIGSPHCSGQSSPLSPTPEMIEDGPQIPQPISGLPANKDGRTRAWSDAPHPSPTLLPPSESTAFASGLPSPSLGGRPKLGPRSNSGNSAIIDRMKGVFAKSTSSKNRHRSKSLLPPESSSVGVDEFGGLRIRTNKGRPSTAASLQGGRSKVPNAALLDLHGGERRIFLDDSPQRSTRTSFSGTTQSQATASTSATTGSAPGVSRGSIDANTPTAAQPARARARASTVSFASSAPAPAPPSAFQPSSPSLRALGATPPRRRPSAISRLSGGRLGSTPNSPKGGSLFPLPPRSSGSTIGSGTTSVPGLSADEGPSGSTNSILLSPGASPRPSSVSLTGGRSDVNLKALAKVENGESVESWLEKVQRSVGREDIAQVLASSGDDFHTEALKAYMAQFDFTRLALDVALRMLLMRMSLPKETQQIDRVIEAFSQRYETCEPGLFGTKDNTYILAFSMMMLHTDAFNKHNKNKMTKADYVRNTRLEGVEATVLEAFFDNITFTPFIYQDEDMPITPGTAPAVVRSGNRSRSGSDTGGYPFPVTPGTATTIGSNPLSAMTPGGSSVSSTLGSSTPKSAMISLGGIRSDLYTLIATGSLATLRVDVEVDIPATSPFSCLGTQTALDTEALHDRFVSAGLLRIDTSPSKKKIGKKGVEEDTVIRVTKVGLLSRRDDSGDHTRKSRKWKSWSVILTGSQLLFFKDPFWALTLLEQTRGVKRNERGQLVLPSVGTFVPDEVFPVKDCVAAHDSDHTTPHTFRFHLPHRQYLMTANDDREMNEWICLINYAAAFKTANIRMRGSQMGRDQAVLAGAAAASSFKREVSSSAGTTASPRKAVFGHSSRSASPLPSGRTSEDWGQSTSDQISSVVESISNASVRTSLSSTSEKDVAQAVVTSQSGKINPLVDPAAAESVKDGGEQLEEIFDVVKAELASGKSEAARSIASHVSRDHHRVGTKKVNKAGKQNALGRNSEIASQIKHFEEKLTDVEKRLAASIIQARNLAILTPFQRSTRERISSAVPPLANRVRGDRLQVARYSIYITILQRDLERDERDFARVRHLALQAAAKSLRDPNGVKGVLEQESASETRSVPTLTLPAEEEGRGLGEMRTSLSLPRTRSPSPVGLLSGDEHELDEAGEHSDALSVLGTTPNNELPLLMRKSSDDVRAESDVDVDGDNHGHGRGEGDWTIRRSKPYSRPTFQRQSSANSVASSNGSFFGPSTSSSSRNEAEKEKDRDIRRAMGLLAPPSG